MSDYDNVADAIDPFIRGAPTFSERCEIRKRLIDLISAAREEGRREERERCAEIVARHPDEEHPPVIDAELMRGCCEEMEQQIRSGKE